MALNFPSNPSVGEQYTVNGETWQWNGSCWMALGSTSQSTETYAPVTISTFPPSEPNQGDLWWNSNTGSMCVYYVDADSSQWVSVTTPPDHVVNVSAEQVVEAFLTLLPSYDNIASAVGGGVPTGGLFKITGATDYTGIRAVATYLP